MLGMPFRAPYCLPRSFIPGTGKVIYNAVGGVSLDERDAAMQREVVAALNGADIVGVRDSRTEAHLRAAGIETLLLPDSAVMTASLFGDLIRERATQGEVGDLAKAFTNGFIAVQFSADFDDDATLNIIAQQLDELASTSGMGIAFFRAGAAPWHDDIECLHRTASRMQAKPVKVFTSLDLWDICALLARSRGYVGSSLHARIIAMAFALPRVNLVRSAEEGRMTKQEAFAVTWEEPGMSRTIGVSGMACRMMDALEVDHGRLQRKATELASTYQHAFPKLLGSS
jgi:hypothetical protein